MIEIPGIRIRLRDLRVPDLEALARWMAPGQEWHEWDGPYFPPPSAEAIAGRIEQERRAIESGALACPRQALVIADAATDGMLGRVSRYWQCRETRWLSVGIDIYDPHDRRRGTGYEALGLWCEYLWRELPDIVRLDAHTWSGNLGMMALALKLGFKEEARMRRARIVRGAFYDSMVYGVLREEWEERYPDGFRAHLA